MTKVVRVNPSNPEPEAILEAARIVAAGGLVAFPTETVYGLGANGLDEAAVQKIFAAKERPASDPLILHLHSAAMLGQVAQHVPPQALTLGQRFWPGPLTLVLQKHNRVPLAVTAGGPSVAARVPAHAVAQALIRAANVPIAAPSANLFSRPSPTRAEDVLEDLMGRVDMVLDGGPTSIGVESTVLSLLSEPPALLRPGGLALETLENALGEVALPGELEPHEATPHGATPNNPAQSPGQMLRHYAPRTPLEVIAGEPEAVHTAIRTRVAALQKKGLRVAVLLPLEDLRALPGVGDVRVALGSREALAGIAASLFRELRAVDRAGLDAILTTGFKAQGLGRALNDRLQRASEGRVTRV